MEAENGHCFLLLPWVHPEQLRVCEGAPAQVTPDTAGTSQSALVVTGEFPGAADLEVCSWILERG